MSKIIPITNGSGTSDLINGTYSVSASVTGYDNSSIQPSSVVVNASENTYAFTISANGTLTLHVTEDGTASGTPVVGAVFVRTDQSGSEYGSSVTTDSNGDAVLEHVPFAATGAPTIYYKQTASDGNHEFDSTVSSVVMTSDTQTVEIQNAIGATRTIQLTDANYSNLAVDSGSLTFTL